jgi:hypothetical protein
VPKGKDLTLASRNLKIKQMRDEAYSMQQIADTVGLSKARVSQILEEYDEEVTAGGYRAFLAANGELALAEARKILLKESPVKVSASGKIMYHPDTDLCVPGDSRGFVPDYNRPILDDSIKVDIIGKYASLLDRLSKLRGADAKVQKDVEDSEAVQEYKQYVQQVITERGESQQLVVQLQQQIAQLTAKYETPPEVTD